MYHSFEVRGFRGIRHALLQDLSRINILTGLNDAGKTTLLEAIFLHASGPLAGGTALAAVRPGRRQQQVAYNTTSGEIGNPWQSLFHNLDLSETIFLSAKTVHGFYRIELTSEDSQQPLAFQRSGAETRSGTSTSLSILESLNDGQDRRYTHTVSVTSRVGVGLEAQAVSVDSRLEPRAAGPFLQGQLIKGGLGPNLAEGYSAVRRSKNAIDLLGALQIADDRISHIEVLVNEGSPELHAEIRGEVLLPIQLLGDGPQAVAQYLVALALCRDGVLLIDEVGAGLHHSVQHKMWTTIHRAAERLNVQVFATTHSDEVLHAAQRALVKRPNELRIHRVKRTDRVGETEIITYSGPKLEAAIEMNAELR